MDENRKGKLNVGWKKRKEKTKYWMKKGGGEQKVGWRKEREK